MTRPQITETHLTDARCASAIKLTNGERTLYVVQTKGDGEVTIREHGHDHIRWGNPTAALLAARAELAGAGQGQTFSAQGCANPITVARARAKRRGG